MSTDVPDSYTSATSRSTTAAKISIHEVLLPLSAMITCILLIPAVLPHARARNLPLCALLGGLFVLNSFSVVNAMVWRQDNQDSWWDGQGLCDVEVKLYIGISQAILGVPACIFRQLANIFVINRNVPSAETPSRRCRLFIFDACVCICIPVWVMGAHYVVQPNRYQIDIVTGCRWTFFQSWVTTVLILVWSPFVCAISIAYALVLSIRLCRHRQQVTSTLASSPTKTSRAKFLRLYILSGILVSVYTPFTILFFIRNVPIDVQQTYTWSAVHSPHWSKTIIYNYDVDLDVLDRWTQIGMGMVCFIFFGLGNESQVLYRQWWRRVMRSRSSERAHLSNAEH